MSALSARALSITDFELNLEPNLGSPNWYTEIRVYNGSEFSFSGVRLYL